MKSISTLALAIGLSAFGGSAVLAAEPATEAILDNYANIALAGYEDALTTAKALDGAVDALIANPSEQTLNPPATPGKRRARGTSRPRPSASATPSSTSGRAR